MSYDFLKTDDEIYLSYGNNIYKKKVKRVTNTQIIVDCIQVDQRFNRDTGNIVGNDYKGLKIDLSEWAKRKYLKDKMLEKVSKIEKKIKDDNFIDLDKIKELDYGLNDLLSYDCFDF